MKIVLLNTLYYPDTFGGAEVSVKILAEGLSDRGLDVHVICLDRNEKIDFINNRVSIHRIPIKNIYWPFDYIHRGIIKKFLWALLDVYNYKMGIEVYLILKKLAPDILHTNNISGFSPSVWVAAKKLNIPIIHTSRDYNFIRPLGNPKSPIFRSLAYPANVVLRHTNKYFSKLPKIHVGISSYILNKYYNENFFTSANQATIYNSTTSSKLNLPHILQNPRKLRNKFTIFGFLGRLSPEKGIELLIQTIQKHDSWAKLVVGGKGNDNYEIHLRKCDKKKVVDWLGQTDISVFFGKIDCLIVPSLWEEPFGRVVIEAFSHGIPVIASSSGGLPELICDGESGFIFDVNDPLGLDNAIEKFKKQNKQLHVDNLITRANFFSVDKTIDGYLTCYQKLVGRP